MNKHVQNRFIAFCCPWFGVSSILLTGCTKTDGSAQRPLMITGLRVANLYIPAGDERSIQKASKNIPANLDIYGIAPHMHSFGTSVSAQ
jgi:hypothetical protein